MTDKKLPPEVAAILNSFQQANVASAAQGLALMKAFFSIEDASIRAALVVVVEKIAGVDAGEL